MPVFTGGTKKRKKKKNTYLGEMVVMYVKDEAKGVSGNSRLVGATPINILVPVSMPVSLQSFFSFPSSTPSAFVQLSLFTPHVL